MMDEIAIDVDNISKKFRVYIDKGHTLKEKILFKKRRNYESREVLRGISFQVKKGEAVGLIGHNGCGKSTTLKLLSKIMYPDSGEIRMKGRVSSLIELGAGFHPDMSGRENIYINASIFGLGKKEIERRLEDIIAFSELEEFIDNPVRTYSSGMYMRLAFAVAINVDADILLIDEILAVGDINFQTKCFEKLKDIKKVGTTIIIVSHSLSQIEQICDRTLWLDDGRIVDDGIPKYVHEHYLNVMEEARIEQNEKKELEKEQEKVEKEEKEKEESGSAEKLPSFCSEFSIRIGNKKVAFTDVKLLDMKGDKKSVFQNGESFSVCMDYKRNGEYLKGNFGIAIYRDDGVHVYGTNTDIEHDYLVPVNESGQVKIVIQNNCLLPGRYMLDVAIHSLSGERYDDIRNVTPFTITAAKRDAGLCRLENHWEVDGVSLQKEAVK